MRDIDAISRRHGRGAAIRRMADVPCARPGGIDIDIQPTPPRFPAERRLGERGATNVAETDEQHGLDHRADPYCWAITPLSPGPPYAPPKTPQALRAPTFPARKSVGSGKSGSDRVDPGGRL